MESWTWQQDRASQIAQEAGQWLTDRGWEQIRQGWHHPVLGKELHTAFAQGERWIPVTAKSIAHLCREGWRTQQWEEFLHSGRRESRILGLWPYDEVRFSHVRKIAQETQGAALAILYGAVSPACFGLRPQAEAGHTFCPFCGSLQADHAHVFWTCSMRPLERRLPANDTLQARLGWLLT